MPGSGTRLDPGPVPGETQHSGAWSASSPDNESFLVLLGSPWAKCRFVSLRLGFLVNKMGVNDNAASWGCWQEGFGELTQGTSRGCV